MEKLGWFDVLAKVRGRRSGQESAWTLLKNTGTAGAVDGSLSLLLYPLFHRLCCSYSVLSRYLSSALFARSLVYPTGLSVTCFMKCPTNLMFVNPAYRLKNAAHSDRLPIILTFSNLISKH